MPLITAPPPPLSYDRDDVVREVTAFYTFLTKMYLPSSLLRIPPPEGWSSITPEKYAWLKKTPTVIDLMRHLPYISREDNDGHKIYPETAVVDYEGEQVRSTMRFAEEHGKKRPDLDTIEPDPTCFEDDTSIPEYMLVLASETSGADGYWWLLDTQRGTVTLYDGGMRHRGQREKGTIENEVGTVPSISGCYWYLHCGLFVAHDQALKYGQWKDGVGKSGPDVEAHPMENMTENSGTQG